MHKLHEAVVAPYETDEKGNGLTMTGDESGLRVENVPNIWGPGAIFSASGLERATDFACPFVGRLQEGVAGMRIVGDAAHEPYPGADRFGRSLAPIAGFEVRSAGLTPANYERDRSVVGGDWIRLVRGEAELEILAYDPGVFYLRTRHLPGAEFSWFAQHPPLSFAAASGAETTRVSFEGRMPLVPEESEWVLVLRYPWQPKLDFSSYVREVLSAAARRRKEIQDWYSRLRVPDGPDAAHRHTYAKAASVLRLNVESAQGKSTVRWTTPDRYPHQHMWLWDSAFHAVGWSFLDREMALEALRAVLERVAPDGFLPICMNPFREHAGQETQPPILGWALAGIFPEFRGLADADRAWIYERLSRFLDWILRNRLPAGNRLPGWLKDERQPRCRCGESGWDNSPRFDRDGPDEHVDLCAFVVRELEVLRDLAASLGQHGEAECHASRRSRLADLVNALLWDEEDGLYYDRDSRGRPIRLRTAACFLPLMAGIPTPGQAARLAAHLMDKKTFLTAVPVPSMAPCEAGFQKDMWRGPTWVNCNYLVMDGLRRYGYDREADLIRDRTLDEINRWYQKTGCLMEYFDCEGLEDPRYMLRKGSRTEGARVIRDFGWTAACYIAMLNVRGGMHKTGLTLRREKR